MSFFDQIYQRLFTEKTKDAPIVFETISRSPTYQKSYQSWIVSEQTLLRDILNAYEFKKKGVIQRPEVHLLNGSQANGLAISYGEDFQPEDFLYLMDHIAERVIELGYKKANSDRIIREKATYTETVEKNYLKPIKGDTTPLDQKYGNILLEAVKINETPSYFKISANTYNDRMYNDPAQFDELIQTILR
jgi:hypothetical protein